MTQSKASSELKRLAEEALDPNTSAARLLEIMGHTQALDSLIAKNPKISKDVVSALLERKQHAAKANLALNPNTPLPILFQLGGIYTEEFIQNLSLELFFIEDPAFIRSFPKDLLFTILRLERLPLWIQRSIAEHPDESIRQMLAKSPNTSSEVLDKLSQDENSFIRGLIATNRSTHPEVLARLSIDPDVLVRCRVIENTATWAKTLREVARREAKLLSLSRINANQHNVRIAIIDIVEEEKDEILRGNDSFLNHIPNEALNLLLEFPELPPWILQALSTHTDEFVRRKTALHPNASVEILERVSKEESDNSRQGAAANRNAPAAILWQLYQDSSERIRYTVAENPSTPITILGALAIDPSSIVRGRVGKNPNTPVDLIRYLARDKEETVREHVAQNPNTPEIILQKLCDDGSGYVAKAAQQELKRRTSPRR